MFSGPIPSIFRLNHHSRSIAIPRVDSFTFRYSIFNRSQWKMLVELPEKNPFNFIIKIDGTCFWSFLDQFLYLHVCIKPLLEQMGIASNAFPLKNKWAILLKPFGPIPLHFRIESVLKVHGKGSCAFLSQVPLSNPH